MSDLVGIVGSRRTLDRRMAENATLSTEESDRLARFAAILALATHVMGGRAEGMAWLRAAVRIRRNAADRVAADAFERRSGA